MILRVANIRYEVGYTIEKDFWVVIGTGRTMIELKSLKK